MTHISCPNCNHHFDDDDMSRLSFDPWELAKDEDDTKTNCPVCEKEFWVTGLCSLQWNTYKNQEAMEYSR